MQSILKRTWPYFSFTLLLIIIASIEIFGLMNWVEAASYNVFFNNVEQGAHSKSNPTLNINGNHKAKQEDFSQTTDTDDTDDTKNTEETPTPAVATSTTSTTTQPPVAEEANSPRRFKLGLLAHTFANHKSDLAWSNSIGGTVKLGYALNEDIDLDVFGGLSSHNKSYYGVEGTWTPVHITLFGMQNFIDFGGILGWSEFKDNALQSIGYLHGGAKLSLNFNKKYDITTSLMTNLTDRSYLSQVVAQAGLTLKF